MSSTLDAKLLAALRASEVHLPATDLASLLSAPLANIEARLVELRVAGFDIEERPGLGYRLLRAPDRLIADDLFSRLGPCTLISDILVFNETGSTNDYALQRGRQGAPGGLAVFAERQTAGRGRFGRTWDSAAHCGLWFSLLLRPAMPTPLWPRLTTWVAASLAGAIENSIGLPTKIKWPNDIYLLDRKVAGILAESGADSNGRPFAVVGMGVNVNHELRDFPRELDGKAGSLRMATGRVLDRPALATALLQALDARFPEMSANFPRIIAEATRRSLLLGRWVQLRAGHAVHEGRAESLDADGHLLLRKTDGSLSRLTAGEVTVIAD